MSEVSDTAAQDFWRMMTSDAAPLGKGVSRKVYPLAHTGEWVLKVETDAYSFQNPQEWLIWRAVRNTRHARWFAPCKAISPGGQILVQRRTSTPGPRDFPKRLPGFLIDLKRENYGLLEGRLVAHDYGLMHKKLLNLGAATEDAGWWTVEEDRRARAEDAT